MGVTVSINGADQRPDQALAKVTRDNQPVSYTHLDVYKRQA